jgi:Metallo-peptidase family M12B Reprolysin-like
MPVIKLHFKVLFDPFWVNRITITEMFTNAQTLFANTLGYTLELVGTENVYEQNSEIASALETVTVEYNCPMNDLSDEQEALFNLRAGVNPGEIVIYFVKATDGIMNGCAAHPRQPFYLFNRPGAIVTSVATPWTLAHEIGHILGLEHVTSTYRLMYKSTEDIRDLPPNLILDEINNARIRANLIASATS